MLLAQTCDSIGKEVAPFNQKLSTKLVQSSSSSSSSTSPFSPSSTSSQSLLSKVTSTTQNNHGVKLSVEKSNMRANSKAHSSNGDDDNDDDCNKKEMINGRINSNIKLSRNEEEDGKIKKEKDSFRTFKKKTSPDATSQRVDNGVNHTTSHHEGEGGMRKNYDKNTKNVKEENVLVDVVGAASPESWLTREARQGSSKQIHLKSKSKNIRSPHATPFIPSHPSKRFKKTSSDVPSHSINVKQTVHGNASRKIDLRSDKGIYLKDYYGSANLNSLKASNNFWFNNQQPYLGAPNNYFDPYNPSNPLLNHQLSHYPSEYEALMKQHSHQFPSTLPSLPPSNPFIEYYMASLYDYMLKMHVSMGNHQHPPTFPHSPQSISATPEFDFNLKSLSSNSNLISTEKVKSNSSEDKGVDRSMDNAEKMLPYTHPWMNPFMLSQSLKNTSNPSYLQLLSLSSQQKLQQQLQQQLQHRNNTPFQHLLLCPFHLHPINEACSKRFSNTDDLLEHVKSHWPCDNNNNDKNSNYNNNNTSHTINHKGQNNQNNNHNNIYNKTNEFEKMKFDFSNHKSNNIILPHLQPHLPYPPSMPHPFMSSLFNSLVNESKKNEASSGISPNSENHHFLFKHHLSNNVP